MKNTTGATVSFIVIFSLLTCLMSCCGVYATYSRSAHMGLAGCYGTSLLCLGFIPLVAVSDALLQVGAVSQTDLVAMCYYDI
jgi:hypothetical protein